MRKKTLGRLLGAVLSLTMVITSVVPAYASGIDTSDVNFYAQNEEEAEETEDFMAYEDFIESESEAGEIEPEAEADENGPEAEACEIEPESVTVTFMAEGGLFENGEDMLVLNINPGTSLADIGAVPEKEGFEFLGWCSDPELLETVDPDEFTITENSVLFAKWQEMAVDAGEADESELTDATSGIILDANGGLFPNGEETYEDRWFDPGWDTYLNDPDMIPLKEGFAFEGWYKSEDCAAESRVSTDNNPYILKDPTITGLAAGDTIYANYTSPWTVTLVYGSDADDDKGYYWDRENEERLRTNILTGAEGTAISAALNSMNYIMGNGCIRYEDPAYSFTGKWYSDEARQNEVIEIWNQKPAGHSTVYYAGYEIDNHVITVHAGEGFFLQQVYGFSEKQGHYEELLVPMSLNEDVTADYSIYEYHCNTYLGNTDPRKTVEGYYLDPGFEHKLLFNGSYDKATLGPDETDIYVKWEDTKKAVVFKIQDDDKEKAYIKHYNDVTSDYEMVDTVEFAYEDGDWYDPGDRLSDDLRWKFIGWSTEQDDTPEYPCSYSADIYLADLELEGDYTLYAVWEKDAYWVVTFNAGDGYFELKDDDGNITRKQSYTKVVAKMDEGESISFKPEIPKIDNDRLAHANWKYDEDKQTQGQYVTVDRDNMVFTALYDTIYTITLYVDDEKQTHGGYYGSDSSNYMQVLYATELAGVYINDAKCKTGEYAFGNWYIDPACTEISDVEVHWGYFYPTEDTEFYAKWLKNYTVTFDATSNGTVDLSGEQTYELTRAEGEIICKSYYDKVPTAVPNDSTKVFAGWGVINPDESVTRYTNSQLEDFVVKENVTFTALYEEPVEVTFVADGGFEGHDGTEYKVTIPKGESVAAKVPTAKNIANAENPQVFIGWSETNGGEVIQNLYDYPINTDTTLYAQYGDCYVVTFKANVDGVTGVKLNDSTEDFKVLVPKGKPYGYIDGAYRYTSGPEIDLTEAVTGGKVLLKNGISVYSSAAWENSQDGNIYYLDDSYFEEEDGTVIYYNSDGFIPVEDTTFTAQWVETATATFALGENETFIEEKFDDNAAWTYKDSKTVTVTVPSGIKVSDVSGPYKSYINYDKDAHENDHMSWGYDSSGNRLPEYTRIYINKSPTIFAKWIEGSGGADPGEKKDVTLHAGKGHFGGSYSPHGTETTKYQPGKITYTSTPYSNDQSKVFYGWTATKGGEIADYGEQKYNYGWSVLFPADADVTDLYAVYGDGAVLTLDANGGYFDESSYAVPTEAVRGTTTYTYVQSARGQGFNILNATSSIKHDGDVVFGGWTLDPDGGESLPLVTSTSGERFIPEDGATTIAYAQWTVSSTPATLSLSDDMTMKVGEKGKLTLVSEPADAIKGQNVQWKVQSVSSGDSSSSKSDAAVVSISADGTVTAGAEGKVMVWAQCNGRRSNAVTVEVTGGETPPVEPKVTITPSELTMVTGQKATLTATTQPAEAAEKLEWTSSNESILTVEGNGATATVTAVKEGKATITAATDDAQATVEVEVFQLPVYFQKPKLKLTGLKGNTQKIQATLGGENKPEDVSWASSDPATLTVEALPVSEPDSKEAQAELKVTEDVTETKTVIVSASVTDGVIGPYTAQLEVEVSPEGKAEAPTANPGKAGETVDVKKTDIVELSSKTSDATILYTLNGDDPVTTLDEKGDPVDPNTKKYSDALRINEIDPAHITEKTVTIKAVAVKDGMKASDVSTFTYKVKSDDWGDLDADSELFEKVKEWFNNDSNNVPKGVWYVWRSSEGPKRIDDPKNPQHVTKTYTGEKVTFNDEVVVFHGTRRLIENRDYTTSYKNNTKAFTLEGKSEKELKSAPTVTFKGKGSYNETKSFAFGIEAREMAPCAGVRLASEPKPTVSAGKNVKLSATKPVYTYLGKKLKEKTDYNLKYYRVVEGTEKEVPDPAKEILSEDKLTDGKAVYRIKATGTGNFKEEFPEAVEVEVVKKETGAVSVSSLKVVNKNGKAIAYDYEAGRVIDPVNLFETGEAVVKNGKTVLKYGEDYTIEPVEGFDYTSAGKHGFRVIGTGKNGNGYIGEKTAELEIKAKAQLSKVKVAGLKSTTEYIGRNYTEDDLDSEKDGALFNPADKKLQSGWKKVTLYTVKGKAVTPLTEGVDYEVESFSVGVTGKFTIVFKGINGCTGTLKKTVTVKTANLKNLGEKLSVTVNGTPTYVKAGATPDTTVTITYEDGRKIVLKQGIDYTVTYKNNSKVFDITGKTPKELKSAPTVTVKGIGNYAGTSAAKPFTIAPGDPSQITAFVKDVVYNKNKSGKSGYFIVAPKLMDEGKAVTIGKGKDVVSIDKTGIKYKYYVDTVLEDGTPKAAGTEVETKDRIPAGTRILVEVPATLSATSPYNSEGKDIETILTGEYRVVKSDISKAKIKILDPSKCVVNNGEPIKLTKRDIEVRFGNGEPLNESDYEIVSVTNNRFIGTATLTIRGTGKDCGGTKTQTFLIKAHSINKQD